MIIDWLILLLLIRYRESLLYGQEVTPEFDVDEYLKPYGGLDSDSATYIRRVK